MEVFYHLISTMLLGMCSYYLIIFIDFSMNDKNIFDWYYKWLLNKVEPTHPKLSKLLGMCVVCFGFWIASFLFILYHYYLKMDIIYYIPYIVVCEYYLIKKITT